jgi:hypothetical protein
MNRCAVCGLLIATSVVSSLSHEQIERLHVDHGTHVETYRPVSGIAVAGVYAGGTATGTARPGLASGTAVAFDASIGIAPTL